jgi:hypothetical protein
MARDAAGSHDAYQNSLPAGDVLATPALVAEAAPATRPLCDGGSTGKPCSAPLHLVQQWPRSLRCSYPRPLLFAAKFRNMPYGIPS